MSAKEKTPADAGVFLSVVFLWSIENGQKLGHSKYAEKLQKQIKIPEIPRNFRYFWWRLLDSNQ